MADEFLILFDDVTGERLDTIPYDEDITPERAAELMTRGYEAVPFGDWNLLVGNVDGQEYVRDFGNGGYKVRPPNVPTDDEIREQRVRELKKALAATDYKCMKYVDGELSEEEYSEVRAYRAGLRNEIRGLGG